MAVDLSRNFGCAVEPTLTLLGGKWKPVLLAHLKESPRSYAELRRLIPRLSDKMLTQRLRDLHRPRPLLAPVLQAMHDWGQRMAEPLGATFGAGSR